MHAARTARCRAPRHWFWSAIAQSWPIYGEVLVASLLINVFALVTPFFTMNIYDRVVPNLALLDALGAHDRRGAASSVSIC